MAMREFPALGFDPAPGDAATVSAAARQVDGAARTLGDASGNVSRLNSSGWTGEAAEAFRGRLEDLPRDLDLAARSHQTTARTLSDYSSGLQTRQRRPGELELRAEELTRQQAAAIGAVNRITAQRAPDGSAEQATLNSRYVSAKSRTDGLAAELAQVIGDARRLHGEHRTAARAAARVIRDVADAPYREPGWLSRAWDSVKGWIKDNADVLRTISTVLKGVSAVLGVLSLVPGLQFLAPFALLTAGARAADRHRRQGRHRRRLLDRHRPRRRPHRPARRQDPLRPQRRQGRRPQRRRRRPRPRLHRRRGARPARRRGRHPLHRGLAREAGLRRRPGGRRHRADGPAAGRRRAARPAAAAGPHPRLVVPGRPLARPLLGVHSGPAAGGRRPGRVLRRRRRHHPRLPAAARRRDAGAAGRGARGCRSPGSRTAR